MKHLDLTILMPCLNEEENIGYCINEAFAYINTHRISGEVLIVDNGSTDSSVAIAKKHGSRVIRQNRRGYGCALRTGLKQSQGDVIIFGDCDSTYDFLNLDPIYVPLYKGEADFVTGNRLSGMMESGAMSLSHRLGVPFLSWCSRMKYGIKIHDFHCGLRGIRRDALDRLVFHTTGMEFATEMIAEANRKRLRIKEVDVPLRKSKFNRTVKLRTIRDGFRHMIYIITS